jgi:hypothetical protein
MSLEEGRVTHPAHLRRKWVFAFRRRWHTTSVIGRLHRRLRKIIEALPVGKAQKKLLHAHRSRSNGAELTFV